MLHSMREITESTSPSLYEPSDLPFFKRCEEDLCAAFVCYYITYISNNRCKISTQKNLCGIFTRRLELRIRKK